MHGLKFKEVQMFCKKVFAEYITEEWQNCCSHMKKLEDGYWQWVGSTDEIDCDYSLTREFMLYEYR
jgi:hypothetical protein